MKTEYTTNSFGYNFITYKVKNKYFKDNVVKFIVKNTKNIIVYTDCTDTSFSKIHDNFDIYVLWIDRNKITKKDTDEIKKIFSYNLPLYPVFGHNYIIITKIISKQIFQLAEKCTINDIGDIYLYEFGAILSNIDIKFNKLFKGTEYPIIWNVKSDYVKYIIPKMHGWFSKNTELILSYALKNYNYETIVELGSWYGKSTSFILQNMNKNTKLYCYDKFQNIANSEYSYNEKSPIDNFYFTTPRYETFCKNISPYITANKKCFTIKYDVNQFIKILNKEMIIPNIIFIDAIKKKKLLLKILYDIFKQYKFVIVIGDDYVFDSVKEALHEFIDNNSKLNYYINKESYLITFNSININSISEYVDSRYLPPKNTEDYIYEYILYKLNNNDSYQIITILKHNNIDINKILFNGNTLYTFIIILIYQDNKKSLIPLKNFIDKNYKIYKINNILGLNYEDYIKHSNLFY
jgi:hypothetical protein